MDVTSSQVLVADSASSAVDSQLWIVAPVCVAVVAIFLLALVVVLTRYEKNLDTVQQSCRFIVLTQLSESINTAVRETCARVS